jgi:hypothetical protein
MPWFPYPGACGGAYPQTGSRQVLSVDQSINCYPQRNEAQTGKAAPGMVNRPGYSLFSTPGTSGTGRALWAGEERLFSVTGTKLTEISSAGVQSVRGDIGAGSGVCTIVSNATDQLMIINPNTDVLSVDDGVSVTTPATPAGARMGFQLRRYGYIVAPDTNTLYQSSIGNFKTWNSPTLQATFITSQDRIVATIEDNGIAWLIGSATSTPVAFTGGTGFALEPIIGAFVAIGTCAPFSPASAGGGVCMVSGSRRGYGQVVIMRPGQYQRISNYAVEQLLGTVTDWGTVVGNGYTSNGHSFYVLDIYELGLQAVFDFTENAWHYRQGWTGSAYTGMLGRMVQCTFNNTYYVISPTDGKIYKQNDALGTDNGVTFRCGRTMPILASNKLTNYNRFRIDMQTGDGSTTVGCNARFSMDGGKSYGPYSYEIMGRNGEANVLEWPQLGQAGIRGFVADVYFDQGPFAVAGVSVDVTPGFE